MVYLVRSFLFGRRVQVRTAKAYGRTIVMPDAGCTSESKFITVRKQSDTKEVRRYSFGEPVSIHNSPFFQVENLSDKVPDTFSLDIGDQIGIAIFRTFNLESQEQAYNSADKVWGKKEQKCGIHTDEVRTGPPAVCIQQSQCLTLRLWRKVTGQIMVRTATAAKGYVTELCKNRAFCHSRNTLHSCSSAGSDGAELWLWDDVQAMSTGYGIVYRL